MIKRIGDHKLVKRMTKRQWFLTATLIVTLGLSGTQFISEVEYYFPSALLLSLFAALVSFLVLKSKKSVVLPAFYTGALTLFYFLLPMRWLTRLPIAVLFSIGFYAILLTENIYNVATGRSIQLLRVARSVGFLMSLLIIFLLFETVISLHLNAFINGTVVFLLSFPLAYQNLWSMQVEAYPDNRLLVLASTSALLVGEVSLGLSFWPMDSTLLALFLTSFYYLIISLNQQALIERLFVKTAREFIIVASIVFLLAFITTSWSG
jgi:membrane protein CcdC involved in cytochrome C biogenesis